jgi:hypothetical protein
MTFRQNRRVFWLMAVMGIIAASALPVRAENLFDGMQGSWSGTGAVRMTDGSQERLRCTASYNPGGADLQMTLRCASDSYKVVLNGQISSSRGKISGTWSEASRQLNGELTGTARPGVIQASATSPSFTAALTVRTSGRNQSISIEAPGTPISNVAIALRK